MRTLVERHPISLVALGVVLFSTGPVLVAGSDTTGPVLSFWRLWIGVVLLGAVTAMQLGRGAARPDATGWRWAVRCGTFFAVHQVLFMSSIKRTSVVDVTLMQLLQPVLVGVLAAILFGERPGAAFRTWSAVSMAGTAVVVLAGTAGPKGDPLGVLLAAGNVATYAVYFVWSKQARDHISTVPFLFGVLSTSAVLVSGYVALIGAPVRGIEGHDLLVAAALAVVPGGLGHFVTTWPLQRVPANVPPLLQLAIPFLAGALAWLVLDQGVTWLHVVGGAVSLVGVVGALRSGGGRQLVAAPEVAVIGE